jgi:hypothetical protein
MRGKAFLAHAVPARVPWRFMARSARWEARHDSLGGAFHRLSPISESGELFRAVSTVELEFYGESPGSYYLAGTEPGAATADRGSLAGDAAFTADPVLGRADRSGESRAAQDCLGGDGTLRGASDSRDAAPWRMLAAGRDRADAGDQGGAGGNAGGSRRGRRGRSVALGILRCVATIRGGDQGGGVPPPKLCPAYLVAGRAKAIHP